MIKSRSFSAATGILTVFALASHGWEREDVTENESEAEAQAVETRRSDPKEGPERDSQCIDNRRDAQTTEGIPERVDFSVRGERVHDDKS